MITYSRELLKAEVETEYDRKTLESEIREHLSACASLLDDPREFFDEVSIAWFEMGKHVKCTGTLAREKTMYAGDRPDGVYKYVRWAPKE